MRLHFVTFISVFASVPSIASVPGEPTAAAFSSMPGKRLADDEMTDKQRKARKKNERNNPKRSPEQIKALVLGSESVLLMLKQSTNRNDRKCCLRG